MEATILLALQSLRLPILVQIAALVSALGNYGFVWIVIALIMIFFAHRNNVGISMITAVLISGILAGFILQPIFSQVRPCDANIGITAVMGVSRAGYSLPSFHAMSSFACATVMAMTAGRSWGTWSIIGALLISISRLYLGVEWPVDVLAGAIIGVLIGIVSAWVYNQFLHDFMRDYPGLGSSKSGRKSVSSSSTLGRRKIK